MRIDFRANRRTKYIVAMIVTLSFFTSHAHDVRVPAGGAVSLKPGSLDLTGPFRIIDGDTIEAQISGNRVGIGLAGVRAPQRNTRCGKEAATLLQTLTGNGIVHFDSVPGQAFDGRKRKMFKVSLRGKALADELVKAGAARADSLATDLIALAGLSSLENEANAAKRGCLWRGDPSALLPDPKALEADIKTPPTKNQAEEPKAEKAAAVEPRQAVSLPSGFVLDVFASGLNSPTSFVHLADGRILIAEQGGTVRVYKNGTLLSVPLLDIRDRVNAYWDRGLLSVASDPNFASNGYVYLLYTYENDPFDYTGTKTARLSRFTITGDTASAASESVILGTVTGQSCKNMPVGADCIPSDGPSHTVGSMKFAADGTLFVTVGDGTPFNVVDADALRSQDLASLAGKVLHITSNGQGINSNPFWNGVASANRSKIWAYGLRNPYRFSLKPGTTKPYLGDVGWSSYEEINVATAGANFGWPCYEGDFRQSGYEPQAACQTLYAQGASAVKAGLVSWPHNGTSSAATGGTFYTGTSYPAEFQGSYFFADYGQSVIRNLRLNSSDVVTGGPFDFAIAADGPVAIEMGPDQNLYYVAIETGELRRIRYVASSDTTPPTVSSQSPIPGGQGVAKTANITVTFSEGMNAATLTSSIFSVMKQGTSTSLPAVVSYDVATRTAKIDPTSDMDLGGTYVVTLKGGFSGSTDVAGNPLTADVTWAFTTAIPPPPGTSYLSDIPWSSATNGWGPAERDKSNGDLAAGDGQPITLDGQAFPKGLGTHANSDIRYFVAGSCSAMSAQVGIDDEALGGSVIFQVWADGVKLYDSGLMYDNAPTKPISVNLTGKNELALIVTDGGDGPGGDHGDWANAQLTCATGGDSTPPTVISTVPTNGASSININDPVSALFSEAMVPSSVSSSSFTLLKQSDNTAVPAAVTYDQASLTARLTPSSSLQPGAIYTATVKGGSAGVKDLAGNFLAADRTWTFTASTSTPPTLRYLSDMTWTSAQNGWGPVERDRSNGDFNAGDGLPLTIRGQVFPKGLGAHAASDIRFNISGTCSTFTASAGVDDEAAGGSVVYQVWADGVKLYDSGILYRTSAVQPINLDLTGRNELGLIVTNGGDDNGSDHADWADAKVLCTTPNTAPTPTIASPLSSLTWKVGDLITYSGSATDAEDGTIPTSGLSWQVRLHHCQGAQCHIHPFTTSTGSSGSFVTPDHGDSSYFELILTASDSAGLTNSTSVTIQPKTSQVTVTSSPAGLQVVYGSENAASAPVTRTSIQGSSLTISAPSPQNGRTFTSWSDGGAQQHNITVGATSATYTATFADVTAPTVTTLDPASGATGVALNSAVTGTFSEAMDPASITAASFTVVRQGTTTALTGALSYTAATLSAKFVPSTSFLANTTYTVTIKGSSTGVKDSAGNALAADRVWSFTTVAGSSGTSQYLSSLPWISAVNGWGPVERDKSNGELGSGDGTTITLNGQTWAKGLGVHAQSDVRFYLGGTCSTFTAQVGVDDEVAGGSIVFRVLADGATLFDSGIMYGTSATKAVNVNVTGKTELSLVVADGGNGVGSDHGDWADARTVCTPDITAPTVVSTVPSASATAVSRTAPITATFSEPIDPAGITATNVKLVKQGATTAIVGTLSYNAATRVVTFTPGANLAAATVYSVTIAGGPTGVKDLAGNALATSKVWTFTTQ